MIQPPQTQQNS